MQLNAQFSSINATCVLGIDKLNLNDNTTITSSSGPILQYNSQTFCQASQINTPSDLNKDALVYDVIIIVLFEKRSTLKRKFLSLTASTFKIWIIFFAEFYRFFSKNSNCSPIDLHTKFTVKGVKKVGLTYFFGEIVLLFFFHKST